MPGLTAVGVIADGAVEAGGGAIDLADLLDLVERQAGGNGAYARLCKRDDLTRGQKLGLDRHTPLARAQVAGDD